MAFFDLQKPLESSQAEEVIKTAEYLAPDERTAGRLNRLCTGEFDQDAYDCGRAALYVFGFIENPSDAIPPWKETSKRLTQIEKPELWALAIYQEQILNHTGIIIGTEPEVLVFSKHGVGGQPQVETERGIMEIYPEPLYFRVAGRDGSEAVPTIA